MALPMREADRVHRTALHTGAAADTVIVDAGVGPRFRLQRRRHDHACKPPRDPALGDHTLGEGKGPETADVCRVTLRPTAAEGLGSHFRIALDALSGSHTLKPRVDRRSAGFIALRAEPVAQGGGIGVDVVLTLEAGIHPELRCVFLHDAVALQHVLAHREEERHDAFRSGQPFVGTHMPRTDHGRVLVRRKQFVVCRAEADERRVEHPRADIPALHRVGLTQHIAVHLRIERRSLCFYKALIHASPSVFRFFQCSMDRSGAQVASACKWTIVTIIYIMTTNTNGTGSAFCRSQPDDCKNAGKWYTGCSKRLKRADDDGDPYACWYYNYCHGDCPMEQYAISE